MEWTLEQFGGSGNGSFNNTTATLAFQAAASAIPNTWHVLNLQPGGHYKFQNETWVSGIAFLHVKGPAILDNTVQGSPVQPARPFVQVPIVLIDTVLSGASTVVAKTHAEASTFSAGEWVLVGCQEQYYSGQPASMRYIEYRQVVSVNAGTGAIVLHAPLTNNYYDDLPYNSSWSPKYGDGRAALFKIENQALWGTQQIYDDIEFRAPNGVPPGVYMCCRRFTANRCSINGNFLATFAEQARLVDCSTTGWQLEIDKCISAFYLDGCSIAEVVTAGTGCQSLVVENSAFNGGAFINPKNISIENTYIAGGLQVWNVAGFCENLDITGGSTDVYPFSAIIASQMRVVQVGSDGVSWDGSALTLADFVTNGTTGWLATAYRGRSVYAGLVTVGGGFFYPTGVAGRILSVTGGDQQAEIEIDFNGTVANGDKLALMAEPLTTNITNLNVGGVLTSGSAVSWPHDLSFTDKLQLPGGIQYRVLGIPSRVEVNVKRAYAGPAGGNVYLHIVDNQPQFNTRLLRQVDLRTTGLRVATFSANSGWTGVGGESVGAHLVDNGFEASCISALTITGVGYGTSDPNLFPVVDIILHFDNPYRGPA